MNNNPLWLYVKHQSITRLRINCLKAVAVIRTIFEYVVNGKLFIIILIKKRHCDVLYKRKVRVNVSVMQV